MWVVVLSMWGWKMGGHWVLQPQPPKARAPPEWDSPAACRGCRAGSMSVWWRSPQPHATPGQQAHRLSRHPVRPPGAGDITPGECTGACGVHAHGLVDDRVEVLVDGWQIDPQFLLGLQELLVPRTGPYPRRLPSPQQSQKEA